MPAHFLEISGETAERAMTMRRARCFGIELAIDTRGSAAARGLRDQQTHSASAAHGKATHTDPQILFSDAS
jgi:hypothetical protein